MVCEFGWRRRAPWQLSTYDLQKGLGPCCLWSDPSSRKCSGKTMGWVRARAAWLTAPMNTPPSHVPKIQTLGGPNHPWAKINPQSTHIQQYRRHSTRASRTHPVCPFNANTSTSSTTASVLAEMGPQNLTKPNPETA